MATGAGPFSIAVAVFSCELGKHMVHKGLGAIIAVGVTAWAAVADAQSFPTRPVTMIVPWVAGGPTDIAMRAIAAATERHLGQPIVIEYRAGAAGTLGPMQMAAMAKPDGYTIAQISENVFRAPYMRKTMFDPIQDLTYIIRLAGDKFGVVTRNDARWTTIQELLADAKANPGKITYGSPGVGGSVHIGFMQIAKHEGIDWIHVPFKGSAEATVAILGGHIDLIGDPSAVRANADKLQLLVTWGAHRTANWPTVPTLKEIGIDMVVDAPYGLAGPKGMDPRIVKVLHDAFKKGMEEPSYAAVLAELDQESYYLDSQDYHDFAMQQIGKEERSVEEFGLNSNYARHSD
jgi:tripartite-type tricarboxylate transporter receptor subunit TctC